MDQDPMVVAPSDGVTRGDSKAMPNKGTSTGFTGVGDDRYGAGAGMDVNATYAMGSAHVAPDPMDKCCPPGGGDFRAGANRSPDPGTSMGSAADSDAPGEDSPDDQRGLGGGRDPDAAEDTSDYEGV